MKANFYKSDVPGHSILKVEGIPTDISESLVVFLQLLPSVRTDTIFIESQNQIRFAFGEIAPEIERELKITIINAIRDLFELDSKQMIAVFLIAKQKEYELTQIIGQMQEDNIKNIAHITLCGAYIKRMHSIVGWSSIITLLAIIVAVVAIILK